MVDTPRKKSPRAPSIGLDEAIERALKVYEKERRHSAPAEVVAQHLGYKNANNGAALALMASLRYYGLLERPQEGKLAVTRELEEYQFAPSDEMRREFLRRWVKSPPVFAELLEKYESGLPSDGSIRFDLIQRGFSPNAAESLVAVFRRSVEFARHFDAERRDEPEQERVAEYQPNVLNDSGDQSPAGGARISNTSVSRIDEGDAPDLDRIPVRLSGGRRAWLLIPSPFYSADRKRLKAQIDLVLAEDEDE